MLQSFVIIFLFWLCSWPTGAEWTDYLQYPSYTVSVFDFGAVGDGVTYDTEAIQSAIDHVSSYIDPTTNIKGGFVEFPSNYHFFSGAFELKSNSFLYIHNNAILYASTNHTDYPKNPTYWSFISAINASNIGIFSDWYDGTPSIHLHDNNNRHNVNSFIYGSSGSGEPIGNGNGGIINGQNHKYISRYDEYENKFIPQGWPNCTGECRPRLFQVIGCTNVTLKGNLKLINSPDWTSHYLGCKYVYINGISVWNDRRWPNGDGIDPDSTQHMIIRNVNIHSGDDGICFKSQGGYGDMYDILVDNAYISSHSSAIKFGSSTVDNIYDIYLHNITIIDSNRGLGIQMRDSGKIYNINFENINIETRWWDKDKDAWWGDAEPIWLTIIKRNDDQETTGQVFNITYNNVIARSENGIFLGAICEGNGKNEQCMKNIKLNNINLLMDKWQPLFSHPSIDYRPGYGIYGTTIESFVNGIRIDNGHNVELNNVNVTFNIRDKQDYWRYCLDLNNQTTNVNSSTLHCKNEK